MTEISRPDLARGAARAGVLLGIVLAVWPAHALRLGPASALSAVGEPLRLEIQVAGLSEAQAAAVKVDLAPASAFRAAAMDYPEVLEGAEVVLARGQDGRPVLRVSSSRSARQPYLDLIVQARWPSGRLERQYTVLLEARASDPEGQRIAALADSVAPGRVPVPARIQPAPSVAAPGAPQAVAPVATPGSPRAVPTGATTTPAVSHSVVVERYTVRPGDTLLGIARRMRPRGMSTEQTLETLRRANPDAFIGADINRLRAGAVLVLPSAAPEGASPAAPAASATAAEPPLQSARGDPIPAGPRSAPDLPDRLPQAAMSRAATPSSAQTPPQAPVESPVPVPVQSSAATPERALPAPLRTADAEALSNAVPQMSAGAQRVDHDPAVFKPDPDYTGAGYDPERQIDIYGGKRDVPEPRPLIERGRPLYREGPLPPSSQALGALNPVNPSLLVYGDWRAAFASSGDGRRQTDQLATRINLEVDWSLTATERVHATFRPLDRDGRFTRHAFSGPAPRREFLLDGQVDALFIEGDAGQIAAGLTGRYSLFDLPFSLGLMPMHLHSGVWMDDAIAGLALAQAGRHSQALGISNLDVTMFAGLDRVSSPALRDSAGALTDRDTWLLGTAVFLDANDGYWEIGLGHIRGQGEMRGMGYSGAAVSFTRRYGNWLSNSVRLIGAFGQDRAAARPRTADGFVVLVENSLITSRPLTLVPYFNAFAGFGRPQSLARDPGAGGLLRNTGILFESDGLTGFPTLDDAAHDTWGGAIGVQYLFDLDRQIVVEIAGLDLRKRVADPTRAIVGAQYGAGLRYQQPLSRSLLFRADAIAAWRENAERLLGVRSELRLKF